MQARQAEFKRGIDGDDARRGRDENLLSLRKNKREDKLAKRRQGPAAQEPALHATATRSVVGTQDLQSWVAKLSANNFEEVFEATVHFRKLLSIEKSPPIEEVIATGIVPRLVHYCTARPYPKLQYEAAWALTNIASGNSSQTKVVVDAGAVPIFIELLRSPDENVREQAIWALGNIAGDSPQNRDCVLKLGAMKSLVENLACSSKISMLRNGTWTLSNFMRGKPQPDLSLVVDAVPALAKLVESSDEEVLTDACWALSYLSDGSGKKIETVVRAGVLPRLTQLLKHSNASIQTPSLRTIGNVATGDEQMTDAVIQAGACEPLVALLRSSRKAVRKEAAWTLSNITAGSKKQIQAVVNAGGVPELVRTLAEAEWETKKEAAWAISNYCSGGTREQIRLLTTKQGIKPICDLLSVKEPKIVIVALDAINAILKAGQPDGSEKYASTQNPYTVLVEEADGLDKIEALQEHPNQKVYEKAVDIIESYFGEQDDDENGQNAQFNFSAPSQSFGGAPAQQPAAAFSFDAPPQQQQFSFGAPGGFAF